MRLVALAGGAGGAPAAVAQLYADGWYQPFTGALCDSPDLSFSAPQSCDSSNQQLCAIS